MLVQQECGNALPLRETYLIMTILSHCYPTESTPTAGIWLKRAFGDAPAVLTCKWTGWISAWRRIRKSDDVIVACWMIPAGIIACLSGKKYILYALGLDCFWVQRHPLVGWLLKPVARRASRITFSSQHLRNAFEAYYGDEFACKSSVVRLPVDEETL